MTLFVAANGANGATQLTLYRVADDAWAEAGLTYNHPTSGAGGPALGTPIQTIDLAAGYTGLVTFGSPSPASSDLATYIVLQLKAGDLKVSFVLRVTSCPDATDASVGISILFWDSENGGRWCHGSVSECSGCADVAELEHRNAYRRHDVHLSCR